MWLTFVIGDDACTSICFEPYAQCFSTKKGERFAVYLVNEKSAIISRYPEFMIIESEWVAVLQNGKILFEWLPDDFTLPALDWGKE